MVIMKLTGEVFTKRDVLTAEHLAKLKEYVHGLPFTQPSFVYHRERKEDVHDTEVRKSHSMSTDDPSMLAFVQEKVIPQACPEGVVAKLARDHVTFIKYEPGGFFSWHQDYEKYTINKRQKWLEMHLLVCLQGADGGELQVRPSEGAEPVSYPHVTNGAIMFDKMMEHQGAVVTGGIKIIMTVDVLVSLQAVLDSPGMSILTQPHLKTGFMAYDEDIGDNVDLPGARFCMVKINDYTVVYDSDGPYYIKHYETWGGDTYTWCRTDGDAPEDYDVKKAHSAFARTDEYYGPLESMLEGDDINIVRGVTELPVIDGGEPIPEDMSVEHLLALPVIDVPDERQKVAYTYHCNESNYGETSIEILYGFVPC